MRIQLVKVAKTPRKTMRMTPGTIPTTAKLEGRESMPLLTISAIISADTSCHDNVLYLILIESVAAQKIGIQSIT